MEDEIGRLTHQARTSSIDDGRSTFGGNIIVTGTNSYRQAHTTAKQAAS